MSQIGIPIGRIRISPQIGLPKPVSPEQKKFLPGPETLTPSNAKDMIKKSRLKKLYKDAK